ncbi:hypothetical protein [Marinobacter zhanjiangensis]|uniref:Porin n=1 Tax=Marinobacter zhanjiangensis TaxID=578215 RepID=A0ABQ3ALT7_9GAMM|nr:hypothetical protein [Marinobacter zhanjiangensis]GGY59049.1 hypothetical protein GCM10007071_01590 [Marinobacter zhanjiangensis]
MAQQSKITSRPLTKALGTASILSMAIAGANVANALETDFGVEYEATAFAVENEAENPGEYQSDTDDGFAHLIRLKGNFKHESGVSLITSIELAGDRWTGDGGRNTPVGSANNGAYNTGNVGDNVRLDLGYVQIPLGGNIFRVGRQSASWNNCFLVCDDRRDRISGIFPTEIGTAVVLYDRRQDTSPLQNQDDGDMVAAGLITRAADMNIGLLWVHWLKDYEGGVASPVLDGADAAYVLDDVHLFSPYVSGNLGGVVDFAVGFNYVFNGGVEAQDTSTVNPATGDFVYLNNDQYFTESNLSQYVRVGSSVGMAELDFQYVGSQDGGLISSGFDSYASVVNTNPESTASAASLYRMGGGLGLKDFDEQLLIGRVGLNLTPQFKLQAAIGHLTVDDGNDDDSSMVYDLQAHYQVNDAVKTSLTAGLLTNNDVGGLSGNSLSNVDGDWDENDAMAVTANLSIDF